MKEALTFTGEDSPLANLMLHVMGSFEEFECALIRERQREGVALVKAKGLYRRRVPRLNAQQLEDIRTKVNDGVSKARIARDMTISRVNLYRALGEDYPPKRST